MRLLTLVALSSIALQACAHSPPSTVRRSYEAQVISEAEIIEANVASAYDVIRKLRANFLTYRGRTNFRGSSASEPRVGTSVPPWLAMII